MTDFNYFDELKTSLEEAASFKKGDKSRVHVTVRELPVPEYDASAVLQARMRLRLSQRGLASALGVSSRTVESWEAGRNTPNGAARNLLYLLEKDNSLIDYLIAK